MVCPCHDFTTQPLIDPIYERRTPREHMHMTCLGCGRVTEFESRLFDKLKKQIETECQFHILVARMELGGYCAKCRA